MNKYDVIDYLWSIKTRDEIQEMWKILKQRSRQIEEMKTIDFNIGDKVTFKDKRNKTETGTITKINKRTINVRTEDCNWRITPSLLTRCY